MAINSPCSTERETLFSMVKSSVPRLNCLTISFNTIKLITASPLSPALSVVAASTAAKAASASAWKTSALEAALVSSGASEL